MSTDEVSRIQSRPCKCMNRSFRWFQNLRSRHTTIKDTSIMRNDATEALKLKHMMHRTNVHVNGLNMRPDICGALLNDLHWRLKKWKPKSVYGSANQMRTWAMSAFKLYFQRQNKLLLGIHFKIDFPQMLFRNRRNKSLTYRDTFSSMLLTKLWVIPALRAKDNTCNRALTTFDGMWPTSQLSMLPRTAIWDEK